MGSEINERKNSFSFGNKNSFEKSKDLEGSYSRRNSNIKTKE